MSSQEVRAKFRSHFLRLAEKRDIPSNDPYWDSYWEVPKAASDLFEGISNSDIRSVCHTRNFVKLLRVISIRLVFLASEDRDMECNFILNCIRILTRFLPYFYENSIFVRAEHQIFWSMSNPNQLQRKISPESTTATVGTIDSASTYSNQDYDKASVEANLQFEQKSDTRSDKVEISLSDSSAPLGAQLVNTAVNLLFTRGFTVDSPNGRATNGIEFSIWEPGIGYTGEPSAIKPELDSNRLEVMRFLTTLCSQCIYSPPNSVVTKGSRYLSVLVSAVPKLHILTLLSSLLNLTCRCGKKGPENGLETGNNTLNHLRVLTVTTAIQLLTIMIVYPLPKDDVEFLENTGIFLGKPFNAIRFYFGRLHKELELNFIITNLHSLLSKPWTEISENERSSSITSMIKSKTSNVQPTLWGIEIIMLFWELYQCNKRFKLQLLTQSGNDLAITLLYNVFTFRNDETHINLVRISSYFLLLLTGDPVFSQKILEYLPKEVYEKFPESFKVTPNPLTYRDFIVTQICQILMKDESGILTPTLNECLFNLIPVAGAPDSSQVQTQNRRNSELFTDGSKGFRSPGGGLSYSTSSIILQLVIKYSAHRFLTGQPSNLDYLALLIRAICQAICRHPKQSRNLIFIITKNAKYFENISVTIDNVEIDEEDEEEEEGENGNGNGDPAEEDPKSSDGYNDFGGETQQDDEATEVDDSMLRPKPPIGMSSKAKGKVPRNASLKRSWSGHTSFNIILSYIAGVRERLSEFNDLSKIDTILLLNKIESLQLEDLINSITTSEFSPSKSNLEPLKFIWTNLSLGWYESILWRSVFCSNEMVSRRFNKTISLNSTISTFSKVSSDWGFGRWSNSETNSVDIVNRSLVSTNIWYGTKIKLFRTDNFLVLQKGNLSEQLMRRFSDFTIGGGNGNGNGNGSIGSPQSPSLPPQPSRQNSVVSISSTLSSPIVVQKDDMFAEPSTANASIKITPRNSFHRPSVSSNFNSTRNTTRNNSTTTTPILGSPRNSISL